MLRLTPSRLMGRLTLAYQLRCARDDARARQIRTPLGVWVCHLCRDVSLSSIAFNKHLASVHS